MEIKHSLSFRIFSFIFCVIFFCCSFFLFIPNKFDVVEDQVSFSSDLRSDYIAGSFYGSSVVLPETTYWNDLAGDWADEYADDGETAYLTNLAKFSVQFTYENMGYGMKYYFSFSSCSIPLVVNTDDASDYDNLDSYFVDNSSDSGLTAQNTTGIVMQTSTTDIKQSYANVNSNSVVPFQYIELPDNMTTVTHPYLFGKRYDGTIVKKEISWNQRLYLQVFDSYGRSAYIPIFINFISGTFNSSTTYSITNNFIGCSVGKTMNAGSNPNYNYVGVQYLTETTDYSMPQIYFQTNLNYLTYNSYIFAQRTYYFTPDQTGYTNGYNDGLTAGVQQGFSQGEQQGYDLGYSVGHSAGVEDANSYSFLGLISAVIDAPIKAVLGLFNFQIFGVDVKTFLLALLTFSVVLLVFRLILKGGS